MDTSLSTSISSGSAVLRYKHITIVRKLTEISRRTQYAKSKRIIRGEGKLEYGGLTMERVGPPIFLEEHYKDEWRKDLKACANRCVWNYLLPEYSKKIEYYKSKVINEIASKIIDDNKEEIERGLQLGRDRANKKWDRREGLKEKDRSREDEVDIAKEIEDNKKIISICKVGPHRTEEIGCIKRGELPIREHECIVIKNIIKQTDNMFRILAHDIYGSVMYSKLVVRNMWKYINSYEEIEKKKFVPFLSRVRNNLVKWIYSWNMFRVFIENRDLNVTMVELDIVGKLYDVRIKIFREEEQGFRCTWVSSLDTEREVKLLVNKEHKWLALEKKDRYEYYRIGEIQKSIKEKEHRITGEEIKTKESNIVAYNTLRQEDSDKFIKKLFGEGSNITSPTVSTITYDEDKQGGNPSSHSIIKKNEKKRQFWQIWRSRQRDKKRNSERKRDITIHKEGIKEKNKQLVFDFTTQGLDEVELELLSKGESFCVTNNKVDKYRLKTDIFNFSRRLRLHEEFRDPNLENKNIDKDSRSNTTGSQMENRTPQRTVNRMSIITQTPPSNSSGNNSIVGTQNSVIRDLFNQKDKIRKPASLYDPESHNRNLNRYINCISEESLVIIKSKEKFKDNISKEQRQAIRTLKEKIDNNRIIISKADKGSGLVVVNYDTYLRKGTRYIEEEAKAYEKVTDSQKAIVKRLIKARNAVVQRLRNTKVIEVETATYCTKQLEEKITGLKFYYKIHKDTNILTMPLRPLQSCINALTHHLSQVLTDILQPFLKIDYIPTYIQDSNQLLFRLENLHILRHTDTLISSDVAALYPSIPHKEGLTAILDFLQQYSTYSIEQIQSIVEALELVITDNYVMWNNQIYKQTSGVAMGTPVAVAYANIFMNWIDGELLDKAPFIVEHIRYIDDNLFILPEDRIEELMQIANNILRPHIKFTYETLDKTSDIGLPFLDTQLFITEGKIYSRLYTKKTDKHAYLLLSSYHPFHITKNIPLAVFNRIRRVCSKEEWFQVDASKAIGWLEDRGYAYREIKQAIETSAKKDRWTMINNIEEKRNCRGEQKRKEDLNKVYNIPYIVTYSHDTQRIKQVLKQRQELLDASFIKTKVRPRLTFRRQQNINDMLVQKGLRGPIKSQEEKVFKLCGEKPKYRTVCPCKGRHDQKICRCCVYARLALEGIKVKLLKAVDCDTKNIIYLIGCNICSKKYIGETQQKLRDRLLQHLNNINKLKQPLYEHFNQTHAASQLYISIVETVGCEEAAFRKVREAWWINKLQTLEPRGFNVKLEYNQIYEAKPNTISIERQEGLGRRR